MLHGWFGSLQLGSHSDWTNGFRRVDRFLAAIYFDFTVRQKTAIAEPK